MNDGFSMDLSGGDYAFQYKPDFVSPLAARFAPGIAKPDYVSPLDTNDSRAMQGRTAAALGATEVAVDQLGGCGSCGGLGQFATRMPYKQDNVSPIAYRTAPFSTKPDFVSPLEPRTGSTRFLQNRTAAALAAVPSMKTALIRESMSPTQRAAIDKAMSGEQAFEEAGNSYEITTEDGSDFGPAETFFKNADGSWKTTNVAGVAVAAGLVAFLALR